MIFFGHLFLINYFHPCVYMINLASGTNGETAAEVEEIDG